MFSNKLNSWKDTNLNILFVLCKHQWMYNVHIFSVVDASHTFYTASTVVRDKGELRNRKYTKILCQCTDPEDKRRIIGDTFMEVSFMPICSLCYLLGTVHL